MTIRRAIKHNLGLFSFTMTPCQYLTEHESHEAREVQENPHMGQSKWVNCENFLGQEDFQS
uniref:Uncharacterized protein n=1 Tax=Lepeophtheirus salmonis TaxID=72036 RepID=A0A0K2SXB7_LEPSM